MSEFHLSELARKFSNMIQIGNIHSVNAVEARARVALQGGEIVTQELPWIAGRAGQTAIFSAPEVGEQCLLISPDGETANAVIILGLYSNSKPQPADDKDMHRIKFKDGAAIEYNQASGDLKADVKGNVNIIAAKAVNINATMTVNITAPSDVNIEGNVNVTGNVAVEGGISATEAMTAQGSIQAQGDVKAGNISLRTHTHQGDSGGTTGDAQ